VSRASVERRLAELSDRARDLREQLRVADEQLAALTDDATEAGLRALVSETPLADREHRDAQRHADAMARHRDEVAAALAQLEAKQDELLDELTAE
jgi:hypothetical protein